MRTPDYLSPSAISLFYSNTQEYYLKYLAGEKPPAMPQTQPMAVGSSFDAYAKSFLHAALFGKGKDPRFDLNTIFEAQVEPHQRDFALEPGRHCFEEYKASGALADLLLELQGSIVDPKFEIEVKGVVNGEREGVTLNVGQFVLLGKPDVFYINSQGMHVILDWKVNGYCSAYNTSPMKGYVRLRQNGINKGQHKEAQLLNHKGILINAAAGLESLNRDWARQLCIYAWLCGVEIGADFVTAIDQLCCKPGVNRPEIRVAEHRVRTSPNEQWKLFVEIQSMWEIITSGYIFRELSLEASQEKCALLDQESNHLCGHTTENDQWLSQVARG